MTQTINSNTTIPANSPDANTVLGQALNAKQTEVDTASGAIAIKNGAVRLTGVAACVMTLAAPVAGTDDFKELDIQCSTAHAHSVTCPSNVLGGSHVTATFAAVGDNIQLKAFNGVWLIKSQIGATLS